MKGCILLADEFLHFNEDIGTSTNVEYSKRGMAFQITLAKMRNLDLEVDVILNSLKRISASIEVYGMTREQGILLGDFLELIPLFDGICDKMDVIKGDIEEIYSLHEYD